MPSGAKKRKAAKKKQASNFPPSSTTHSQSGDDDLKYHDGGEGKSDQGEGVVQIDWKFKSDEDNESTGITVGSEKKSDDGSSSKSSSSSSSSSSSDDESHVVEKNIVVVEDASPNADLVEPLDSLPESITQEVDDLVKSVNSPSEGVPQVEESSLIQETYNLAVETHSVDKISLEEVVHVIENVSIENGSSSHVAESFRKGYGVEKLPSLDKDSGISALVMDLGSNSEDKENIGTSLGLDQDLVAKEIDATPSDGAGNIEQSETPHNSYSQPLVASAPQIVQTTSWKSCCGIFELFTGSSR